jgi:hypothetical protein
MAYVFATPSLGMPAIASSTLLASAVQPKSWKLGDIQRAVDPDRGAGEFIYLKGVASTIVGSWVTYNQDDFSTALLVPNAKGPVAVAMSAHTDNTYGGWYQIQGKASAKAADVADSGDVYIDTAAGFCDDAFVLGDLVIGARWASDEDTGTSLADVRLARPFVDDGDINDTA